MMMIAEYFSEHGGRKEERGLVLTVPFVLAGLAVASALVDVSQQMCVGYKEKSGGLRNRKQQPSAQPSTCI